MKLGFLAGVRVVSAEVPVLLLLTVENLAILSRGGERSWVLG